MTRTRLHSIRQLPGDCQGAVVVEFGLLGPLMIAMLLGVLQIGVAMQSYNAIRNASADVARHAAVQYQTDNRLTNAQIRQVAMSTAVSSPYLLQFDGLDVSVRTATTQRVAGATELQLEMEYEVPTLLTLMGWSSPKISYERPIFVR